MKYKLLILFLFISLIGFSQHQTFIKVRNDSVFFAWVIAPTDTVLIHAPNGTPVPYALFKFDVDSAKANIRNQIVTLIGNNSTALGRDIMNTPTPASNSVVVATSNGAGVTRTATQFKQDLSIDQVSNTSDATKNSASAVLTNKTIGAFNTATDAQANDSYVVTLSPAPAAYTTGMMVIFRANTQNTTACSINVNGLGVKSIVKRVNTTPATGDILALQWCMLVYDGTNFVLLNPVVN